LDSAARAGRVAPEHGWRRPWQRGCCGATNGRRQHNRSCDASHDQRPLCGHRDDRPGLRQNNGPVTLAAISQRQQISLSYLEQLFGKLRRHELVESTRGPGGGYTLGRKASEITVADIIVSVDEPIDATQCAGKENCNGEGGRCMTHELWSR
jgi:Rrf2 family protein